MAEKPAIARDAGSSDLSRGAFWLRVLIVFGLLFLFLCGVNGLGAGFKGLGKGLLEDFFRATSNPFIGLTVGILGTTLVQSSSVTTSMIVAMVASGSLGVGNAVPMIMGANIGTTVTNTIVSLGHMGRKEEFKRAFAAATCHDFFNFITVAIMLPLELATGVLQKSAGAMADALAGSGGAKFPNPLKDATKAALDPLKDGIAAITDGTQAQAIILIVVSALLIFSMLFLIVKVLRTIAASKMESIVTRALGRSAYLGVIVGMVVTVMVQSSSITTSVMVPLAGAGLITLEAAFPLTVGANIGTTVTALLASLAAGGAGMNLGLQIALVHLLFNLAGTLIIFVPPFMRDLPLRAARWLANIATRSRKYALLYVVGLFYGLPAVLIALSRAF